MGVQGKTIGKGLIPAGDRFTSTNSTMKVRFNSLHLYLIFFLRWTLEWLTIKKQFHRRLIDLYIRSLGGIIMLDEKSLTKREELLNQIETIHTTFFNKVKEYETERSLHPGSEHSVQLYQECKSLAAESEKLIDQL